MCIWEDYFCLQSYISNYCVVWIQIVSNDAKFWAVLFRQSVHKNNEATLSVSTYFKLPCLIFHSPHQGLNVNFDCDPHCADAWTALFNGSVWGRLDFSRTLQSHSDDLSLRFRSPLRDGLLFETFARGSNAFLRCSLENGRIKVETNLGGELKVSCFFFHCSPYGGVLWVLELRSPLQGAKSCQVCLELKYCMATWNNSADDCVACVDGYYNYFSCSVQSFLSF